MTTMQSKAVGGLRLREPRLEDGKAVHELIRSCPPLDVNSAYNYFLLCSHFSETCVIGERDGQVLAFLSAYRVPKQPDRLFIWQMAVDTSLRGLGMATRLIETLLQRPACDGIRRIETTVSPSNIPSRRVFERFAAEHGLGWEEEIFLTEAHFGGEDHEAEVLFRIGPISN